MQDLNLTVFNDSEMSLSIIIKYDDKGNGAAGLLAEYKKDSQKVFLGIHEGEDSNNNQYQQETMTIMEEVAKVYAIAKANGLI